MSDKPLISRNRDDYKVWTSVTIRYSDQDPMQHINNVAIAAYLEARRSNLLRTLLGDFGTPEAGMVLASVTMDFVQEMSFPGVVEIGGRLSRIGNKSFSSEYAIFQGEICRVVSRATTVFFDTVNRTSREPEPQLLEHLKTCLAQQAS